MFKPYILIFAWLLLGTISFSQIKVYRFLDEANNADINRGLTLMLDTAKPGVAMLNSVFKPVEGKFKVYRFLAMYQGLSFSDKQKEFHDVLIVKTNAKGKIIEAYQYTLEWAEPPFNTDLYRSTCKHTYLVNNMEVDKFVFVRPWYYDKKDRALKDSAILKLGE